jgi:serine/threonine protein kinase
VLSTVIDIYPVIFLSLNVFLAVMIDIHPFDHRLGLVSELSPLRNCAGSATYKVSLDGSFYVMKIASTGKLYNAEREELLKERDALRRADDINNITHLEEFYDHVPGYIALLKMYVEGDTLGKLQRPYDRFRIKKSLTTTIDALHETGISSLDIHPENIIISPDGRKGTLIDFNIAVFVEECTAASFERHKKRDYLDLRNTFS